MIAAFSITPIGSGESVGAAVAEAVRLVRASGLPNETNAMFTNVEGEWDEVMDLIHSCVEAVSATGREGQRRDQDRPPTRSGRGCSGREGRLSRRAPGPGVSLSTHVARQRQPGSGLRFPCPAARPPPGETQGRGAEG